MAKCGRGDRRASVAEAAAPIDDPDGYLAFVALLVIDLDGTLLSRDGSVSRRNREAIDRARDAGFEVVLATGRSWKESRGAISAIDLRGMVIGAGGSTVNDATSGRTLLRELIEAPVVADLAGVLLEHGHRAHLLKDHDASDHDYCLVGEHELDEASRWWFEIHELVRVEVGCALDAHRRELTAGTLRVGSVAPAERLSRCAAEVISRHGDRVHAQQWGAQTAHEVVGSNTHLLEIFSRGVDKWSAVEWICREREVDPSRVVAIGDGLNDVGMIRGAGLGVAMGNSLPQVREVADRVVAPFDRDGVAEAIEWALAALGAGGAAR